MQPQPYLQQPGPASPVPNAQSPKKALEQLQHIQLELSRMLSRRQSNPPGPPPQVLPLAMLTATPSLDSLLQRMTSKKRRDNVSDINSKGTLNLLDPVRTLPLVGPSEHRATLLSPGAHVMSAFKQADDAPDETVAAGQSAVTTAEAPSPPDVDPTPSPFIPVAPAAATPQAAADPDLEPAAADTAVREPATLLEQVIPTPPTVAEEEDDLQRDAGGLAPKYNPWDDDPLPEQPDSPRQSPWEKALADALAELDGVQGMTGVPLDTSDPAVAVAQLQQQIDALKQQHLKQLEALHPAGGSAPAPSHGPVVALAPLLDLPISELKRANLRRSTSSSYASAQSQQLREAGGSSGGLLPRVLSRNRSSAARVSDASYSSATPKLEGPRGGFSFARMASFNPLASSRSSQNSLTRQGSRRGAYPDFQVGKRVTESGGTPNGDAAPAPVLTSSASYRARHSHTSGLVDQPWDGSAVTPGPARLMRSKTHHSSSSHGSRVEAVEAGSITISGPHAPPPLTRSLTSGQPASANNTHGPVTSVAQALSISSPAFLAGRPQNGEGSGLAPPAPAPAPALSVPGADESDVEPDVVLSPSARASLPSPLPPHPEEEEEEEEQEAAAAAAEEAAVAAAQPSQDGSCKVAAETVAEGAAAVQPVNKPGIELAAGTGLVDETQAQAEALTPDAEPAPAIAPGLVSEEQLHDAVDLPTTTPAASAAVVATITADADAHVTAPEPKRTDVVSEQQATLKVVSTDLSVRDTSVSGWTDGQVLPAANSIQQELPQAAAVVLPAISTALASSGLPAGVVLPASASGASPAAAAAAGGGGGSPRAKSPLRALVASHHIETDPRAALASHQIPLPAGIPEIPKGSPKGAVSSHKIQLP